MYHVSIDSKTESRLKIISIVQVISGRYMYFTQITYGTLKVSYVSPFRQHKKYWILEYSLRISVNSNLSSKCISC